MKRGRDLNVITIKPSTVTLLYNIYNLISSRGPRFVFETGSGFSVMTRLLVFHILATSPHPDMMLTDNKHSKQPHVI